MTKLLSALRTEPIRALLWPVLVGIAGYLVVRGVVDQFSADMIVAIVAAILGIPAAEVARTKVTPDAKLRAGMSSERG
ncbi:hypothetical protein [Nocardia abscessus]|uniref:hypothetical protein n=1 Tax=Nocardia abscessus TaxID=120957 RepID=UPI00031071A0|nr:hypothetical protein [Nocardia abscessus]MCC3333603.1 hypothetical protein [Nocardia abscessus]